MKILHLRNSFLAFLLLFLINTGNSQTDSTLIDCGCPVPADTDGVCVILNFVSPDSIFNFNDTIVLPSECLALCWGFTADQILGHCDYTEVVDTNWYDCGCPIPTDSDGVCVITSYFLGDSLTSVNDTIIMPSECLALCWGFTADQILGHCDYTEVVDTNWYDCGCPIPTDSHGVCVITSYFLGDSLTSVNDTIVMPSECLALCWGFTADQILGHCDYTEVVDTNWYDCGCPIPTDSDGVCVITSYFLGDSLTSVNDTIVMPSECLALCWGFTADQILGHCDYTEVVDTNWYDCGCPIPTDSDGVCVVTSYYFGDSLTSVNDTIVMPSECLALCWGFTADQILGHCDYTEVVDTNWYDCGCPIPTDSDGVCVVTSYYFGDSLTSVNDTIVMPSECLALCWGFTADQILGHCDYTETPDTSWLNCNCPPPIEGEGVCAEYTYIYGDSLNTFSIWFESECLALCYGIPESMISHDCDSVQVTEHFYLATKDGTTTENIVKAYPNPFSDNFTINYNNDEKGVITISSIDGRVLYKNEIDSNKTIDGSSFKSGIYIVTIQNKKINKTLRLIKI